MSFLFKLKELFSKIKAQSTSMDYRFILCSFAVIIAISLITQFTIRSMISGASNQENIIIQEPVASSQNSVIENTQNTEAILLENFTYHDLNSFRDVLNTTDLPYDEGESASFFDKVKLIDNALIQTLNRLNIPSDNFSIESTRIKMNNEIYYIHQKIRLNLPEGISKEKWDSALSEQLELWANGATIESQKQNIMTAVYLDKECTHEIYINTHKTAKISLVIDDLGNGSEALKTFLALDYPVTFSILPRFPKAELYSTIGHFGKYEVFLHQPMSAKDPIFSVPEGFEIDDSQETIKKKLEDNLKRVFYATGINNHTGSLFTANTSGVIKFLTVLKEIRPDMNILDSYTIGSSKLAKLSLQFGFNTATRKVFIDNIQKESEILKQLDYTLSLALEDPQKHIVAIGHPHKATLNALKNWNTYKNVNVEIIHVF